MHLSTTDPLISIARSILLILCNLTVSSAILLYSVSLYYPVSRLVASPSVLCSRVCPIDLITVSSQSGLLMLTPRLLPLPLRVDVNFFVLRWSCVPVLCLCKYLQVPTNAATHSTPDDASPASSLPNRLTQHDGASRGLGSHGCVVYGQLSTHVSLTRRALAYALRHRVSA